MEIETQIKPISTVISEFKLQDRLYKNVLEGVSLDNASKRPSDSTNHFLWLAGHLVSTRYGLAQLLGLEVKDPFEDVLGNSKAISDDATYPTIEESLAKWNEISPKIIEALENVPVAQLGAECPVKTPIGDSSFLGAYGFFAHHEAYHIGQLGYLRKLLGYPAMQY